MVVVKVSGSAFATGAVGVAVTPIVIAVAVATTAPTRAAFFPAAFATPANLLHGSL